MLEIIIGTITQEGFRQQLEDGEPSVEKMADVLLDQLEFSGMLPPERGYFKSPSQEAIDLGQTDELVIENTWEPEDV